MFNLNIYALIAKLIMMGGLIDSHQSPITEHDIITILPPLQRILALRPSRRGDNHHILTIIIHLLKNLSVWWYSLNIMVMAPPSYSI